MRVRGGEGGSKVDRLSVLTRQTEEKGEDQGRTWGKSTLKDKGEFVVGKMNGRPLRLGKK